MEGSRSAMARSSLVLDGPQKRCIQFVFDIFSVLKSSKAGQQLAWMKSETGQSRATAKSQSRAVTK
jgi:hypothetical protein